MNKKALLLLAVLTASQLPASAELPEEADDLIGKLSNWELDRQAELQREIREKRQQVIRVLETILKKTTKKGDLDGAMSIRKEIERLRNATLSSGNAEGKDVGKKAVIPEGLVGEWDWYRGEQFLTINREGEGKHTHGWDCKILSREGKIVLQRLDKDVEYTLLLKGKSEIVVEKLNTDDSFPFSIRRVSGMERKLQAIMLPKVELEDVTLVKAIKFFIDQSRLHDAEKIGVNVILRNSAAFDTKVTMSLTDVSLLEALRKLSTTTGLSFEIQRHGVFLGSSKEHK